MIVRSSSLTAPAGDKSRSAIPPAANIAAIPAALGSHARPARDVRLGSFAALSCQKIIFDLQLANLAVQDIDLCLAGCALGQAAALKKTLAAQPGRFAPGSSAKKCFATASTILWDRVGSRVMIEIDNAQALDLKALSQLFGGGIETALGCKGLVASPAALGCSGPAVA
jgi:hypothetical protein